MHALMALALLLSCAACAVPQRGEAILRQRGSAARLAGHKLWPCLAASAGGRERRPRVQGRGEPAGRACAHAQNGGRLAHRRRPPAAATAAACPFLRFHRQRAGFGATGTQPR